MFVSTPRFFKILVSGGLHHFDDPCMRKTYIYVHENECNIMLHSSPVLRAYKTASWVTSDEILIKPYPEWSGKDYQVNGLSKAISIKENHTFDLGNFKFQVSYYFNWLNLNENLHVFVSTNPIYFVFHFCSGCSSSRPYHWKHRTCWGK